MQLFCTNVYANIGFLWGIYENMWVSAARALLSVCLGCFWHTWSKVLDRERVLEATAFIGSLSARGTMLLQQSHLLRAIPAGMRRVRHITKVHKRSLHLTHAKSRGEEQLSYSLLQGSSCTFESKHWSVPWSWAPLGFLSQGWAGIALALAKLDRVFPELLVKAGCLGGFFPSMQVDDRCF